MTPRSGSKPNWPADATVGDIRSRLAKRLAASRPDDAPALADWLLAELLGTRRSGIPRLFRHILDDGQRVLLATWTEALERQEPLQHVLGYTDFHGRHFTTDRRALIPRPETEELVEAVLRVHPRASPHGGTTRFIDVGTGSGCIAVTLALERPAAGVVAVDISTDALALARENAERHGVAERIVWIHSDIRHLDPVQTAAGAGRVVVVSNPPYIPTATVATLEPCVRDHEPARALDGGPDGLDTIRILADWAGHIDGLPVDLFMEIGSEQGDAVRDCLQAGGWSDVRIRKDLNGLDRMASGSRGPAAL